MDMDISYNWHMYDNSWYGHFTKIMYVFTTPSQINYSLAYEIQSTTVTLLWSFIPTILKPKRQFHDTFIRTTTSLQRKGKVIFHFIGNDLHCLAATINLWINIYIYNFTPRTSIISTTQFLIISNYLIT